MFCTSRIGTMARTIGSIATGFLVWWVAYGVALLVIGGTADAVRVDESVTTFLAAFVGGLGGGWVADHAMRRVWADAPRPASVLPVCALAVLWVGSSTLSAPSAEMLRFRVIAAVGIVVGFTVLAWMAATGRILARPRRTDLGLSPAERSVGPAIQPALIWMRTLGAGCSSCSRSWTASRSGSAFTGFRRGQRPFFLPYIPVVGSVIDFPAAVKLWGWAWLHAAGFFLGPMAVAFALILFGALFDPSRHGLSV
jgi:hypothetical protein